MFHLYKQPLVAVINHSGKVGAYALGGMVILLALVVYLTQWSAVEVFEWLESVFSVSFLLLFFLLVSLCLYAIYRLRNNLNPRFWLEAGLQASSGIATLALTFTLLGISLGIGALSEQTISPDTVQDIIKTLTRNFSTAFMTTVVGLPVANILRAAIVLCDIKRQQQAPNLVVG